MRAKVFLARSKGALTPVLTRFNVFANRITMLLRISLILAIIAALAAGGLGYYEVSTQIPALTTQRDTEHTAKVDEIAAHKKTKADLAKTKSDLAQTQQELSDTKGERDKAVVRADAQSKRADDLATRLVTATQERDAAQTELASFKAIGLAPEQIIKLNQNLKNAQAEIAAVNAEKAVLQHNMARLQTRLDKYEGTNAFVTLRADLRGKILVVDPKWDFVVLNIGDDQGVLPEGELLVSRDGKLVAKVIVRSVEKDRSIANVVPGWKLGQPLEGDEVSPAHPAT